MRVTVKEGRSSSPPDELGLNEFRHLVADRKFRALLRKSALQHARAKLDRYASNPLNRAKYEDTDRTIQTSQKSAPPVYEEDEDEDENSDSDEDDDSDSDWDDDSDSDSDSDEDDDSDMMRGGDNSKIRVKLAVIRKNLQYTIKILGSKKADAIILARLKDVIDHSGYGLKTLEGRADVIDFAIGTIIAFAKNPRVLTDAFLNCAILGGPGTGKTTAALVLANVFFKAFILASDKVSILSATDLIAHYTGQTGAKTKATLMENLEGVLFLDEAYALAGWHTASSEGDRGYGGEAMAEIVNFLDKARGLMVMMVAGYPREMEQQFFAGNPGLDRRFPIRFVFGNYDTVALNRILVSHLSRSELSVDEATEALLLAFVAEANSQNLFPNQAGDMLNLSSLIARTAYTSPIMSWKKLAHRSKIVERAIDIYLRPFERTLTVLT